jgi:hypothetical protein
VVGLAFDKTGSMLAVQSTDDTIALYDTNGWTKKAEVGRRELMSAAVDVNLFAALERSSSPTIHIHSLVDGSAKGKIAFPPRTKIASFGLSANGSWLAVLIGPNDSKEEPNVASRDVPRDLRGSARTEFVQKNDGKVSQFVVYDVPSGRALAEKTVYYSSTSSRTQTVVRGNHVVFLSYQNVNAKITPAGEVTIFETMNSFNYGIDVSADGGLMLSGGLRKFSLTNADTLVGVTGEIPRIPGWPEYFKSFAATAAGGGAIYGATSAYRVVKLGADGKVLAIEPVK